ncbi:MAG TPA: fibronectin type III domain-containing protein [Acidimicrobiales bacterium]|nr:MAG: hypothetical protein B7Z69_08600 [Actinobacteria bacterium 21-73-9]HQU26998.1 fibronectin type III domain-containing protein [Acidimicrobiales bacterium]
MARVRGRVFVGALVALVVGLGAAPAGASPAPWQTASPLAGIAGINAGGYAQVSALSCPATGACVGAGGYSVSKSVTEAFVASESGGVWSRARALPGFATLNAGGQLGSSLAVSCPAAGQCVVGGSYTDAAGVPHAFIDVEVDGVWSPAEEVPGMATLTSGALASALTSVSCSSAGSCAAGGIAALSASDLEPWVDVEVGGVWGPAVPVPGMATLDAGQQASVFSVSCASAGCAAAGQYTDANGATQVFVVSESAGVWSAALPVPGPSGNVTPGQPLPPSIACPAAGACSLAYDLKDVAGVEQAYVDTESGGVWPAATPVSGVSTPAVGAVVLALSCAAPGECAAVGAYGDGQKNAQAMVVDEVAGAWRPATELPASGPLNAGGGAVLQSVDCYAAGACVAGGVYTDATGFAQALIAGESGGVWGPAEELPGSATLNVGGDGDVSALSCTSAGGCAAGGYFSDAARHYEVLVDATAPLVVPEAPLVRLRGVGARSVRLAVSAPGASAPASEVEYSLDGGPWRRGAAAADLVVGGLRPATTYRIGVRLVDVRGPGPARRLSVRTR